MYYQNYEDYMRSVLGYPIQQNTYEMNRYGEEINSTITYTNIKELEGCYPEIYKKINPIVCEVCDRYTGVSYKNEIENLVEEVYQKIIINNEILVKINVENKTAEKSENRVSSVKYNSIKTANIEPIKQARELENRQRRPNDNKLLRDLIRILIINRFLGGGSFPERPPRPRPPFPGPGRPPFPGDSGGMPMRPPLQREYNEYIGFNN